MTEREIALNLEKFSEFSSRLIPISRIEDLKQTTESVDLSGEAGDFIRENYLTYDFKPSETVKSILVISFPTPHAYVDLEMPRGEKRMAIPAGYHNPELGKEMRTLVLDYFTSHGRQAQPAFLPLKLLASKAGLTQYGKNNLSYVGGSGSEHRLAAFFTDLEPIHMDWSDTLRLSHCEDCGLCVEICPYQAIPKDSFLLDVNRCMSFYLDLESPLPQWHSPSHQSTLIGCIHCQECCPLNTKTDETVIGKISACEVDEIIETPVYEDLTPPVQASLQSLDIKRWYTLFRRNLLASMA